MEAIYPFSGISDVHLQSTFGCGRVPMICQYSTCAIVSSEGLESFFCLEAPNEGCLVMGNMQTTSPTSSLKPFASHLPISQKSATG